MASTSASPLSHHDTEEEAERHGAPTGAARRLGRVDVRGIDDGVMQIDVELPLDDMETVLRSAATGHVGLGSRR